MKLTIDDEKKLGLIWFSIFELGENMDNDIESYDINILSPYIEQLELLLKVKFNNRERRKVTLYMENAFSHGHLYNIDQIGARINDLEEELLRTMNLLDVNLSLKTWEIVSYGMDLYYQFKNNNIK